jgi:hypothetical protein
VPSEESRQEAKNPSAEMSWRSYSAQVAAIEFLFPAWLSWLLGGSPSGVSNGGGGSGGSGGDGDGGGSGGDGSGDGGHRQPLALR